MRLAPRIRDHASSGATPVRKIYEYFTARSAAGYPATITAYAQYLETFKSTFSILILLRQRMPRARRPHGEHDGITDHR